MKRIKVWVARDYMFDNLFVYSKKPKRHKKYDEWTCTGNYKFNKINPPFLFPDITWESEPLEIEVFEDIFN